MFTGFRTSLSLPKKLFYSSLVEALISFFHISHFFLDVTRRLSVSSSSSSQRKMNKLAAGEKEREKQPSGWRDTTSGASSSSSSALQLSSLVPSVRRRRETPGYYCFFFIPPPPSSLGPTFPPPMPLLGGVKEEGMRAACLLQRARPKEEGGEKLAFLGSLVKWAGRRPYLSRIRGTLLLLLKDRTEGGEIRASSFPDLFLSPGAPLHVRKTGAPVGERKSRLLLVQEGKGVDPVPTVTVARSPAHFFSFSLSSSSLFFFDVHPKNF